MCPSVATYSLNTYGFSPNKACQKIQHDAGMILKRRFFVKTCHSKVMALFANLEQLRRPSTVFFQEISFYASFEAYSYIFTAQTTGLWKIACDSLAQTREQHRYTDHEY